ncbi:hypothetical protein [Allorhizocola rhizosphaerae]|nr:hypothetical protein [Allorhizocola rhizosphaerae]
MPTRSRIMLVGLTLGLIVVLIGPVPAHAAGSSLTWQPCPSEPGSRR